jgi:general stress protein 26
MNAAEKVWQMMRSFESCMFVTQRNGDLRARPMAPVVAQEEGRIYFLSRREAGKNEEIRADSAVNLAFSNDAGRQVSVSGRAAISTDPALKERLWGLAPQAFLPEGPASEETVTIVVTPSQAEYWERDNAVAVAVELGVALATGQPAQVGVSEKTRLRH